MMEDGMPVYKGVRVVYIITHPALFAAMVRVMLYRTESTETN